MATRENVRRLFSPRSIVFVGGKALIETAVRNCEALDYEGRIYAVNPKYEEIAGRRCSPSVAELPEAPDAAFVGVRRELSVGIVRELAGRGTGGCVCYAAGFAELSSDGAVLQEELSEAAGEMALVGPNCYGLLNYLEGAALWPDLHGGERVERGVALVSQSGNISLNLTMADRSLPLSHVVSAGNQAVLGIGDYVEALVDDPRVAAIGLYIEGLKDVSGFSRAASRALERGVPLAALKAGTSELGSRVALNHTNSLSGPDELYDALFERLGVIRVGSLPELVEALKLISTADPLAGGRLGVLAGSGGDSAQVADRASPLGLELPEFTGEQTEALRSQLGEFAVISNPLDYNTAVWGDREELARCFSTVMEGGFDATLLTLDYPRPGTGDRDPWDAAVDGLISAREQTRAPAVVLSTLPELLPQDARGKLLANGIAPLQGVPEALAALKGAVWYGKKRKWLLKDGAKHLTLPAPREYRGTSRPLDEWESKRRLAGFGLRVPEGLLVSAAGAAEAAQEIGFPVVVKSVSSDLAHKSDSGAVALGLNSVEEVEAAVVQFSAGKTSVPADKGLVERMVRGAVMELIVGVKRDEKFGLALVIGAGGTLVNLIEDSATVLLPAGRDAVAVALDSLRVSRLLNGFRNGSEGDREAVIDAALAVAALAEESLGEVLEVEVNPLLVLPRREGVAAADALIRIQD